MKAGEFDQHVQQAAQFLQPFAYGLTKNKEDSNDLLQETMLRAYVGRHQFQKGTNLYAWLYTIMRNTFISIYKSKKGRISYSIDDYSSKLSTTENVAYSVFLSKDIDTAMHKVPKSLLEPFLMYFRGFKYQEIAKTLGVPVGTVKNRIHLARRRLQAMLKSYRF